MGRKKHSCGGLPFSIDSESRQPFVLQMAEGIRAAVEGGFWKPGDRIPSQTELARMAGVSRIVARHAVAKLAKEGWIAPRKRFGSVVVDRRAALWRGRVLIVTTEPTANYCDAAVIGVLRSRLTLDNYLVSQAAVVESSTAGGDVDYRQLDAELRRRPDLVFVLQNRLGAYERVRASGARLVVRQGWPAMEFPEPARVVEFSSADAMRELRGELDRAHVRTLAQLVFLEGSNCLPNSFPGLGFERGFRLWRAGLPEAPSIIESVRRATMDCLSRRLSRRRRSLPDAIYIEDEYAAATALTVFGRYGVRIPEDVGLVVACPIGNRPCYHRELSRIEMDPVDAAHRIADYMIGVLDGEDMPRRLVLQARFVRGETLA